MALLLHQSDLANGTFISVNVTVPTGTNRRCVVGYQVEGASGATLTATLDSVSMTAVSGAGGTVEAAGNSQHLQFFQLLDADMPASGTVALEVTSSVSPAGASVHVFIVDDAPQSLTVASSGANVATGTTNPKTVSLSPTDGAGYVFGLAGCGNQVDYAQTFGGDAPDSTEEQDAAGTTTGHSAVWVAQGDTGATTLSATATGTVNRQGIVGFAIDFESPATETDVTGALTQAAADVSGSLNKLRAVSGALAQAATDVAGSLNMLRSVSGALAQAPAEVAASLDVIPPTDISGALQQAAAVVSGSLGVEAPTGVSGALQQAAATVSGTLRKVRNVSGALTQAATTPLFDGFSSVEAQLLKNSRPQHQDTYVGFEASGFAHPVNIRAGSNRILVAFVRNRADIHPLTSVTVGGVAMIERTGGGFGSPFGTTAAFYLLESSLPADGPQDLVLTFSGGDTNTFVALVQHQHVLQVEPRGERSFGAITESLGFPLLQASSFQALTAGETAICMVVQQTGTASIVGGSSFAANNAAAVKTTSYLPEETIFTGEGGPILSSSASLFFRDITNTAAGDHSGVNVGLLPFFDATIEGPLTQAAATVAGLLSQTRNASGALQQAAAVASGSLRKVRDVSGALAHGAADVAGVVTVGDGIQGELQQAAAVVSGALTQTHQTAGALQQAGALGSGSLTAQTPVNVAGSLQQAAAVVTGSARKLRSVSGALQYGAAAVAGSLLRLSTVSGSLQQSAATVVASIRKLRSVAGALTQSGAVVAGDLGSSKQVLGTIELPSTVVSGALSRTRPLALPANVLAGTRNSAIVQAGTTGATNYLAGTRAGVVVSAGTIGQP